MKPQTTAQALEAITDEGLFEQVATAILRTACPICQCLIHPGVNAAGKTVKAPLDGICFVPEAIPPHMVAVHHTTTASDGLRNKWLHDPATVAPRKGRKPTAPPGDIIKTAAIISQEKKRTPDLRATLILTTNEEPDQQLIRDVQATCRKLKINVDIWSRSRLCHVLDTTPAGQWIRAMELGIDQDMLSPELLHKLSQDSLKQLNMSQEDRASWVPRALDDTLSNTLSREMTFLVARSGLGKTVACLRLLSTHLDNSGFGLILHHETIATSFSLERAVMTELHHLHPALSPNGPTAFELCSPNQPMLLVVEDINKSDQPARLAERIASWSNTSTPDTKGNASVASWRLICPIWPESLSAVNEQMRKRIDSWSVMAERYSQKEGTSAVMVRANLSGKPLSELHASEIASALGYDPLLIGLHDPNADVEQEDVIDHYIEHCIRVAAYDDPVHPQTDYRQALQMLSIEMLIRRQIELNWHEVKNWLNSDGTHLALLSRIAHHGTLLRLAGSSTKQQLMFRHDRVQDRLLADGVLELYHTGNLSNDIVADPFFAEILGAALVRCDNRLNLLEHVALANPLAIFETYRLACLNENRQLQRTLLQEINAWLDTPETHAPSCEQMRRETLAVLSRTESKDVPELVRKYRDRTFNGQSARLRNGDLIGGIELCLSCEPGIGYPWRDSQIEHAKLRYGNSLTNSLKTFLKQPDLSSAARVGALRLAGHIASDDLASGIKTCWDNDSERLGHLADYLWAVAECCGKNPPLYLGPVCDAWAALSDKPEKEGWPSPRNDLAANELRWAFTKCPPVAALDYFIHRAQKDELQWPITYMLHSIDHPRAVLFITHELATILEEAETKDLFSLFKSTVTGGWNRAQEKGSPMCKVSRDQLLPLWQHDQNKKYLRSASLSIWAATQYPDDLDFLRSIPPNDYLFDQALAQRLLRGDQQAIPTMIEKLNSASHPDYWWQYGRYVWSQELTQALDQQLLNRGNKSAVTNWGASFNSDWIISELLMELPPNEGESLLCKHWNHLRYSQYFIQAALYFATPVLQEHVKETTRECPEPSALFEHLITHWGHRVKGRTGIKYKDQIVALVPFFGLMSQLDIESLWRLCNKKGWLDIRHKFLDKHISQESKCRIWSEEDAPVFFDQMLDEKHLTWVDHNIDDILTQGVSWESLCIAMTSWLKQKHTLQALKVAASVLNYMGTRKDVDLLKCCEDLGTEATQLVNDTIFSVYRRTLH